jgi:hypothetical protein
MYQWLIVYRRLCAGWIKFLNRVHPRVLDVKRFFDSPILLPMFGVTGSMALKVLAERADTDRLTDIWISFRSIFPRIHTERKSQH